MKVGRPGKRLWIAYNIIVSFAPPSCTDAQPLGTVLLNSVQPFENEIARNLGGTISARCLGGQFAEWLMDGSDLARFNPFLSIPAVIENNAGFYQCQAFIFNSPEFDIMDTVASIYALIQGKFIEVNIILSHDVLIHSS